MFTMAKRRWDMLSQEFKIAVAIYYFTKVRREKAWFTRLADLLKNDMSQATVIKYINRLVDFGIVKDEFGITDKGRVGRLLTISNDVKDVIARLYEKFWISESEGQ